MKVVVIAHNLGMGGVERASCNFANVLSAFNHEVSFVALIPKESFFKLADTVRYVEPQGFNHTKLNLVKTLLYIRREVTNLRPDVIIGFTKFFAALANLALLGTGSKLIVSERSSPYYKWPFKVELFSRVASILRKPHAVLSQTSVAAKVHRQYYRSENVFVLPNAVRPVEKFNGLQRREVILCVGRLGDDCKGFDLMVKAFNFLKNTTWELHFAGGDVNEGRYLVNLAADDSVRKRIRLHGRVRDIDKMYAQAGIFVLPSRSEGFPNALLEAMAAGTPCVSFDFIAGPRDIITDGVDGCIVPPNDIHALARKIDALIVDTQFRNTLSVNAAKKAQDFSESVIGRRLNEILETTVVNSERL